MQRPIQMLSICLAQATGLQHETDRFETVTSWQEADAVLSQWSGDRPEQVDYAITFADGTEWEGGVQIGPGDRPVSLREAATSGLRALMSLDPQRAAYRKWIDPTGEKRLQAVYLGARYDFGCDTAEPARTDREVLRQFMSPRTPGATSG